MENTENKQKFLVKYQAETAGVAAVEVLKLLGNTDNLFMLSEDPAEMEKNNQAYQAVLSQILLIFSRNKVGLTNYGFVFNGIKAIITGLEQHMNNHVVALKKELTSRYVGTRNPLDAKYDIEYATHEDLIQALLRVRESQGNKPEDYFTILDKPEEGVPSPIQRHDIDPNK